MNVTAYMIFRYIILKATIS